MPFRSTIVPQSKKTSVVALRCDDSFDELLLSLRVDENSDATCDRIGTDENVTMTDFNFIGEDCPTQKSQLIDGGESIRLRGIEAGADYQINVNYSPPEGVEGAVSEPVLRVELRRPPKKTAKGTSA